MPPFQEKKLIYDDVFLGIRKHVIGLIKESLSWVESYSRRE